MDKKTFEIFVKKNIPYLTTGLLVLFVISSVIFLAFFGVLSSDSATPEIQTFYLIETRTIPLVYGSAVTAALTFVLFLRLRQLKRGVLVFYPDKIELIFKKEQQVFLHSDIKRIYCNDSENNNGEPNKNFTMTIVTMTGHEIPVRIRHTSDIKSFTDKLLSYKDLDISYSPNNLIG